MNAAISEGTGTLFVLLVRTGLITTVILLAAFVVIRCHRGASAAVRHRIWFAAVLGCWAVPVVLAFVPVRTFSIPSPPSLASSPLSHEPAPADLEIIEPVTADSESVPSGGNRASIYERLWTGRRRRRHHSPACVRHCAQFY
jgi:hypothetical protein